MAIKQEISPDDFTKACSVIGGIGLGTGIVSKDTAVLITGGFFTLAGAGMIWITGKIRDKIKENYEQISSAKR
jgi:hypothetical protein